MASSIRAVLMTVFITRLLPLCAMTGLGSGATCCQRTPGHSSERPRSIPVASTSGAPSLPSTCSVQVCRGSSSWACQSYIQDLFNGGALIIAVGASVYVSRRRAVRLETEEEGPASPQQGAAAESDVVDDADGLPIIGGGGPA